jgi:hypothetical protein
MFPLADMVKFFTDKFACLSGRRFSLAGIFMGALRWIRFYAHGEFSASFVPRGIVRKIALFIRALPRISQLILALCTKAGDQRKTLPAFTLA